MNGIMKHTTPAKLLDSAFQRLHKSRASLALTVALIGWLAVVGVQLAGSLDALELKSLDLRSLSFARPDLADTSVIIVAIDQNSLDFFDRQQVRWPWPREFYALLVEYLNQGGARTIAFDIDFSGHDIDRLESDGTESDRAFAKAIQHAGNVVLSSQLAVKEPGDQPGNTIADRFLLMNAARAEHEASLDRAIAPLPEFQSGAARLGVVNFESDPDGIARRTSILFQFERSFLPHFGLACFAQARRLSNTQLDSTLRRLPLTKANKHILYWYGKGGPTGAFKYYSSHALIYSALKMKQGLAPDVPSDIFKNKIAVIGGSAAGLFDFKPTPFTSLEPYPGMELQATMVSNLLNNHFIRETHCSVLYFLSFLMAFVVSAVFFKTKNVGHTVMYVLGIALSYLGITFFLFYKMQWWLPVVAPEIALAFTFALSAVVSYATEGRQKRQLKKAFNRYLSRQVVAEILENIDQIELGGKLIEGTVYFSDIKNFTTISEQHAPKDLVALLNEYLSLASDCILRNDAMLDKYIGDAVMAIFGAPIQRQDHGRIACFTALEVQQTLTDHYSRKAANNSGVYLETRIGLNSGNMIVGNIGHTNRLDYTAIGDTVNLASRLEGVNKVFGTNIIISESTYLLAREFIRARELDLLRVKGKQLPIRIYELIAKTGSLPDPVEEKLGLFAEALTKYRTKEFAEAVHIFQRILSIDPADGHSLTYIERCRKLAQERLLEDWDGVYTLTTK